MLFVCGTLVWHAALIVVAAAGPSELLHATAQEDGASVAVSYGSERELLSTSEPRAAFTSIDWDAVDDSAADPRETILAYCGEMTYAANVNRVSRGLVAKTKAEDPVVGQTGGVVDATEQSVRFLGQLGLALAVQPMCQSTTARGYYADFAERDNLIALRDSGELFVLPGLNSASKNRAHAEEFIHQMYVTNGPMSAQWKACAAQTAGGADACGHGCEWSGFACRSKVPVLYTIRSTQGRDVSWVDDIQGKNEEECIFQPNRAFVVEAAEERLNDPLASLSEEALIEWFVTHDRFDFAMYVQLQRLDGAALLARFDADGSEDFWMHEALNNYDQECLQQITSQCMCSECPALEKLSISRDWMKKRFVLHGRPGRYGGLNANTHRSFFEVSLVDAQARVGSALVAVDEVGAGSVVRRAAPDRA